MSCDGFCRNVCDPRRGCNTTMSYAPNTTNRIMTTGFQFDPAGEAYPPPVAGRLYAKYENNKTYFLHTNQLGSTGVNTDQAGNWIDDEIYNPWGQRWGRCSNSYDERFASLQKRDAESGLDPTPNRMFTSSYGRWLPLRTGSDHGIPSIDVQP